MKCSLILVVVLTVSVLNCDAFLFTKLKFKKLLFSGGFGGNHNSYQQMPTTTTEPPPPPPMIDFLALIGPLFDIKASLTNSLRDQVNQKFDQKIQHINSLRGSFTGSGSGSGSGSISGSASASISTSDDSFSLDDDDSSDSASAFYEVKVKRAG